LGLSGRVPVRVDAATKAGLLALLAAAVDAGWSVGRAAQVLELGRVRAHRWAQRAECGALEDRRPGGAPVHGLLAEEAEQILAVFEQWAEVDRSHRKLAHRGSYLGRFWASPSSVRRVLVLADKHFRPLPRPGRSHRRPFPEWADYTPNSIWIYDTTHFTRAGVAATVVQDLVSRKWLATIVSGEESSTQIQLVFTDALEAEDLMEQVLARIDSPTGRPLADPVTDDPARPILLAVSDNGPQMTSGSTREFMALHAIATHFGRPGTPTDQAWIETFFGHLKLEWPHLLAITEPAMLRAELDRLQVHWNAVRLHAGIGYVTPLDEHEGRGPGIRKAREAGLEQARQARLAFHRAHRKDQPEQTQPGPDDVG
jgi:transposase InsO family protein